MWKSHLTYKLWEIRARKHKGNLPAPDISHPQPNSISSTVNYGKQKLAGPGHVSSRSKSDQVISPVYENQKTIKTQSFPEPSQTFSPLPIQTEQQPLSPNSSLLRPSSSYSPTPRVVEAHKPEQTDTDPGETYSPVLGRDDQHNLDNRGQKPDELLLSDRLSDSEIGNEEIISPRSPVQEYNTNLQPISNTKLTPIESRESSENDFLHGHTLENNVVEINGENMLKVN